VPAVQRDVVMLLGRLLFGLVVLVIAGCTQYWANPGGTKVEFDATKSTCTGRSYSQFRPVMQQVQISSGYTTPMYTTCNSYGYSASCYTTGGDYVPPAFIPVVQNQSARKSAVESCLYGAGWVPAKNREEAEAITNAGRMSENAGAAASSASSSPDGLQLTWDTARARCRVVAEQSSLPFSDAFDASMKQHGFSSMTSKRRIQSISRSNLLCHTVRSL
jgi:hypothetical protein